MDYYELITHRESIRSYDPDKPVSKEVINRILEAGRMAPSACNLQPFKFIVVTSHEKLALVRDSYRREWFHHAPHILIIVGQKDKAWVRSYDGYNSIETDVAIAMTHIILAAENEGVGTCWIEAYDPAKLRQALELGDNQVVFAITPLGYTPEGFKKKGEKARKLTEELSEFI